MSLTNETFQIVSCWKSSNLSFNTIFVKWIMTKCKKKTNEKQ